jgi:hypothetical protein
VHASSPFLVPALRRPKRDAAHDQGQRHRVREVREAQLGEERSLVQRAREMALVLSGRVHVGIDDKVGDVDADGCGGRQAQREGPGPPGVIIASVADPFRTVVLQSGQNGTACGAHQDNHPRDHVCETRAPKALIVVDLEVLPEHVCRLRRRLNNESSIWI